MFLCNCSLYVWMASNCNMSTWLSCILSLVKLWAACGSLSCVATFCSRAVISCWLHWPQTGPRPAAHPLPPEGKTPLKKHASTQSRLILYVTQGFPYMYQFVVTRHSINTGHHVLIFTFWMHNLPISTGMYLAGAPSCMNSCLSLFCNCFN